MADFGELWGIIMSRFRGRFDYSLDDKGRLAMPAKFRKALNPEAAETFVVVRGPNQCLQAYPEDTWVVFEDDLQKRPATPQTVRLKRAIYDSLTDTKLDSQGRVSLSPDQCVLANIKGKALLIGQGNYIEIWDPQTYQSFVNEGESFDDAFYQSVSTTQKA